MFAVGVRCRGRNYIARGAHSQLSGSGGRRGSFFPPRAGSVRVPRVVSFWMELEYLYFVWQGGPGSWSQLLPPPILSSSLTL